MILVASGRHRIYPWIALGGLLFNIVVNIVLIPRMSFNGAAVATVSTELLLFVAIWVVVRQSLPVHRMFPMLPLGAAVALCAVVTVAGTICVERLGVHGQSFRFSLHLGQSESMHLYRSRAGSRHSQW